jgi:hypothetical protein
MVEHSFHAMMYREKSSSTVERYIHPHPMILKCGSACKRDPVRGVIGV